MKTFIAVLSIMLTWVLYAGSFVPHSIIYPVKAQKKVVANMQSMIEGQIVFEVLLGSHVKKGEMVEEIDPTGLDAQVALDHSNLDYCKHIYDDAKNMKSTNSIATETYLSDKNSYIAAFEQYVIDKVRAEHCRIYSPFNGIVTKITTYPGSGISDGSLIMQITKTA